MTEATQKVWAAPGPGRWELDTAHQSKPFSRYMMELFQRYFDKGWEEAAEHYGVLICGLYTANIDGWFYARPKIAGEPKNSGGGLPPRWLFSLALRLHPALRRSARAADRGVAGNYWRRDAENWFKVERPVMETRLGALAKTDVAALDDAALAAYLDAADSALGEGFRIHFRNALAHWVGVGDWLAHVVRWTGMDAAEALHALQGSSPASVGTLTPLDRIVETVRGTAAERLLMDESQDAGTRLAALRQSSEATREAIDLYLSDYGAQTFTGFDLLDLTLAEAPDAMLRSLAARLQPVAQPETADLTAAIRAKVPGEHQREHDSLFETARLLYGLRDDDVGLCYQMTTGLVRRGLLEAGRRLTERGRLQQRDDVFEATPEEVRSLSSGRATVSGDELARRTARREAPENQNPPAYLGAAASPPPPDDWIPGALGRVNRALMLAFSLEMPVAEAETDTELPRDMIKGLAASRGSYEGRACVVSGPADFDRLRQGDVLVAPFTTPAYNVILPLLGGVVTDHGGVLSHAAIVAREYRIPAVVATGSATKGIPDGAVVRVDGEAGTVEVVSAVSASQVSRDGVGSLA